MLHYPEPYVRYRSFRTLLWIVIGGGAFFLFVLAVFTLVYLTLRSNEESTAFRGFGNKIGVVDLEGVIISPKIVVDQLKKFGDDDSIKAIILREFAGRRRAASERSTARSNASVTTRRSASCLDRVRRRQRRLLCFIRYQQNLCGQRQHRRFHRSDRRVGELRRPVALGQAEGHHHESR